MRTAWLLGAAGAACLALAPAADASDDCGCDPPPVVLAQATESVRTPATLTVVVEGQPMRLEADTIEGLLDDGPLEAQGGVIATYRDLRLSADHLRFDRRTGEGLASGSVTVSRPPYHLVAESLAFDVDARTAEATRWQGRIEGAVRAQGRLLTMTASRSVALDSSLSPCLADDPGYRFDFARLDWVPQAEGDRVEGRNSFLVVGGAPIFWLPYFQSTFKAQPTGQGPEVRTQFQAGYDTFDGFYLSSTGNYELAPGWTGRVPVRLTTQRGVTLGVEQRLPLDVAEGRLDAFYTTPFPGEPGGSFIPGPRANLSLFRDLPGGTGILSLGYRVDVNNPFRIGPFPTLSNQPVSRLPEFSYYGLSREWGPLRWTPSARLGYLMEENGASSPLGELALSAGGPAWQLPGGVRLSSFGSLRGDVYRSLEASELALGPGFLGQMARGVGQAGLAASAEVLGARLGASAEVVRVASATPGDPDGTPFVHDAIVSQDRLVGSVSRHLFGPFSVSAQGVLTQAYAPGPQGWAFTDSTLSLSYQVNCLSVQFTYQPLIKGWGFSYLVTTF